MVLASGEETLRDSEVTVDKAASCSDSEKRREFSPSVIGAVMIHVADVEAAVHWY